MINELGSGDLFSDSDSHGLHIRKPVKRTPVDNTKSPSLEDVDARKGVHSALLPRARRVKHDGRVALFRIDRMKASAADEDESENSFTNIFVSFRFAFSRYIFLMLSWYSLQELVYAALRRPPISLPKVLSNQLVFSGTRR